MHCCPAGHFTADVLDGKGRWFRHNDALVQQIWPGADVGLQRSREETAYMLVYVADGL
jgi:ubiquitin C-terminal hydrolase